VALSEELSRCGLDVHLLSEHFPSEVVERLARGSITTEAIRGDDLQASLEARALRSFDNWVLDSYQLEKGFLSSFASRFDSILIDDEGLCAVPEARAIVNPNAWADPSMYGFDSGNRPQLLCGANYVLLRNEIRERKWTPNHDREKPFILVAPGGNDATGIGPFVVDALAEEFEGRIEIVETFSNMLLPEKFIDSLASADVAVIGCGTTTWEAIALGVPIVSLLVVDNQEKNAEYLRSHDGYPVIDCRGSVPIRELTTGVSTLLSSNGHRSHFTGASAPPIDGFGAQRVVSTLFASGRDYSWL
jgi:spore coat polysaccharide biosynthesis predicted glycosyltransferase SpsG